MKNVLDRIVTSNPIDRTSRLVTQKGAHYEGFKLPNGALHSEDPLPMRQLPRLLVSRLGQKSGRFTVVGFSKRTSSENIWVVKCSCGRYETRGSSALNRRLKNPDLPEDMCFWCTHIVKIRAKGLKAQSVPLTPRTPPPGKKYCGTKSCTQWIMDCQEMCWKCLPDQSTNPRIQQAETFDEAQT